MLLTIDQLEAYRSVVDQSATLESRKNYPTFCVFYVMLGVAISNNGNSFVANLYKDIMKTFNVEVKFTPAYHAATNGGIERQESPNNKKRS